MLFHCSFARDIHVVVFAHDLAVAIVVVVIVVVIVRCLLFASLKTLVCSVLRAHKHCCCCC